MIFNSLLGKLFRIRENSAQRNRGLGADEGFDGAEMPFLDHLEDLRKMLFRIIITLMIAMIACFAVNEKLLDWIRLPMKWANIGGGGPAFFKATDNAEDPNIIKVSDWVVTRGGFVGRVKVQDKEAGMTQLAIGDPPQFVFPSADLTEIAPPDPVVIEPAPDAVEPEPEAKAEPEGAPETSEGDETPPTNEEATETDPAPEAAPDQEAQIDAEADETASSEEVEVPEVEEIEAVEEPQGIQVGSTVATPTGSTGKVVSIDEVAQTTTVEIGDPPLVWLRSSAIVTKLQKKEDTPEEEKHSDDPRSMIANQNFLVMEVFQPYEALVLTLKLAFFAGLVISFPLVIFFVAQFVLPGLRQVEKRVVFPSLAIGFLLFLVGAAFAFSVGLPLALDFLADYTLERGIEPGWRIGYYIKFVTQVTLVFGLAFELPVVVMSLVKLDLLTYRTMRDSRAYAIVVLMVLSAFLTPPDPMTLVLLSVPLILLYEICIWLAYFIERKELKQEAEEERRRAEERAQREKERQERIAAAETMTEEEKRELVAEDIEKYEASVTDDDVHALDSHDDPHHDEHVDYHHEDPHHDWDHDYHHHDPHAGMPTMIDINNASIEELQKLPGVGPKLAERLFEARPYYSEDELEYHAHLPQSVIKLIVDRIYYG